MQKANFCIAYAREGLDLLEYLKLWRSKQTEKMIFWLPSSSACFKQEPNNLLYKRQSKNEVFCVLFASAL